MASKKGKDLTMSYTVAPPADAPSLDLESLNKQFRNIDVSKTGPSKPSTSRGLDSFHKPSSSSIRRHEPSHQPSLRAHSDGTVKSSIKYPPFSSIRETQPPACKASILGTKGGQAGGHNLDSNGLGSVRHSERSPHPLDKILHHGQSESSHSSHTIDKKLHISSSRRQPSRVSSSRKKNQQTAAGDTAHVKTEQYKVGNMKRTFVEGMVPATQYAGSSNHKNHAATSYTKTKSFAPANARSILISHEDLTMAARQTTYANLLPAEKERQENWAQSMIQRTGSCPEGYSWKRIRDGYQCCGGHHVISDELLAEGLGGVYALEHESRPDVRWGPYYAEPSNLTVFLYRGPLPKPSMVPDTVGGGMGLLSHGMLGVHGNGLNAGRLGPGSMMGGASRIGLHRTGGGLIESPSSRFHTGTGYPGSGFHGSGHCGGSGHGGGHLGT